MPLTFCDQCGWLQPGLAAACGRCGVPLDRSVYDPFVAISQNAAIVRQAIRGRAKPSAFGRFALVSLGLLYLLYSALFLHSLLAQPFSPVALVFVLLDLVIRLRNEGHPLKDALIEGGLVPMRRWGEAADIGAVCTALATGAFGFATGSVLAADGGLSIARL